MRSIITLGLLLCFSFALAQQQEAKLISIGSTEFNMAFFSSPKPVVSGRIINALKEDLANLSITYSLVTPFAAVQSERVAIVNKDGTFKITLDYPFPCQQIWINLGEYFYSGIYVSRGLALELDFAQLKRHKVSFNGKGVKYSGQDGALTNWLNNLLLYKRSEQLKVNSMVNQLKYGQANYLENLDSLYSVQKNIEDEYTAQKPSPYSVLSENERLCSYYSHILFNANLNKIDSGLWKKIKAHKPLIVSNNAANFTNSLYFYGYQVVAKKQDGAFDRAFGIPYADALRLKVADNDVKGNESELRKLSSIVHTPWVKVVLQNQHRIALKRLNEVNATLSAAKAVAADSIIGTPIEQYSFGAKLSAVGKTNAADFLAKLKNRFKNKALIIDFWATWCGPCLSDLPYSLKLHNQVAGLPIEFLYLCTSSGSSIEKWKNKIIELKQPGTHIFIDERLTSELMQMFGKGGYPSYVCLDQDGKVSKSLFIDFMSTVSLKDVKKLISQ
jgi:thiol-disulfide isomerase/thioredoxin